MVANPCKFHIIFLGQIIDNRKIAFAIEIDEIKYKKEVNMSEKITFNKHIANICR